MTAQKVETTQRRPPDDNASREAAQIEKVSQLPRDLAVIKMENDSIMAMAAAHPRDYVAVLADIKDQLAAFPSFAESAVYAKPVGRLDKCPKCGWDTNYKAKCPNNRCGADIPQKIARGLSIRASEALCAAYKYNRVRTDVADIDGDKVRIEATFVDYQSGRLWQDATVLSKVIRKKDGGSYRIPDDRFYNVVVQARKSILIRECVNRTIPPGVRAAIEEAAEEAMMKTVDDAKIKKILAAFAQWQVNQAMLEKFLGKPLKNMNTEDHKVLVGLYVGIRDGETSVADAFESDDAPPAAEKTQQKAEDIKSTLEKGKKKHADAKEAGGEQQGDGEAEKVDPMAMLAAIDNFAKENYSKKPLMRDKFCMLLAGTKYSDLANAAAEKVSAGYRVLCDYQTAIKDGAVKLAETPGELEEYFGTGE